MILHLLFRRFFNQPCSCSRHQPQVIFTFFQIPARGNYSAKANPKLDIFFGLNLPSLRNGTIPIALNYVNPTVSLTLTKTIENARVQGSPKCQRVDVWNDRVWK